MKSGLISKANLDVGVLVRTHSEIVKIIADCPFLEEAMQDPTKVHCAFLTAEPDDVHCEALAARPKGDDDYRLVGRHLFLHHPNGAGRATLTMAVLEKVSSIDVFSMPKAENGTTDIGRHWHRTELEDGFGVGNALTTMVQIREIASSTSLRPRCKDGGADKENDSCRQESRADDANVAAHSSRLLDKFPLQPGHHLSKIGYLLPTIQRSCWVFLVTIYDRLPRWFDSFLRSS